MNGMIELTRQPLDPEEVTALVRRDSNGAVVTFLGATRDFAEGKPVAHLEYEAYEPMALKKLEEIRQELRPSSAWPMSPLPIASGRWTSGKSAWWLPSPRRTAKPPF